MPTLHTCLRLLLLGAAWAAAGPVSAAAVFGNLSRAGQPLAGAELRLECPGGKATGKADASGNFNLSVPGKGRCALFVGDKTAVVVLGAEPARYDFDVPADGTPMRQR
jgi:hypothetical protein